jgi:hypothetical protein
VILIKRIVDGKLGMVTWKARLVILFLFGFCVLCFLNVTNLRFVVVLWFV